MGILLLEGSSPVIRSLEFRAEETSLFLLWLLRDSQGKLLIRFSAVSLAKAT